MALFGRKKQNNVLPDEVSEYYQSQRRERIGVAILLGLVALVVTLLIAAALFFGGRYIYRQFFADDKTAPTVSQPTEQTDKSGEGSKEQVSGGSQSQSAAPAPAPSPTPSTSQTNSGTSSSTSGTSSSTTTPQSTPNLGDEQPLPRTGDEGM